MTLEPPPLDLVTPTTVQKDASEANFLQANSQIPVVRQRKLFLTQSMMSEILNVPTS